jgi:ATP-dependent Lhr-like helicase
MGNVAPFGETVCIHAADPLNLVGIVLPGERIAANSGRLITLRDGVPVESEDTSIITSLAV